MRSRDEPWSVPPLQGLEEAEGAAGDLAEDQRRPPGEEHRRAGAAPGRTTAASDLIN